MEETRKRSREEAEEVGEAWRGVDRRKTICQGLKIPLEVVEWHTFLYIPTWHERIASGEPTAAVIKDWKAAFTDFRSRNELRFSLACKREEFFALADSIGAWLEGSAGIDGRAKAAWRLPFDLTNKLVSLIVYATTGNLVDESSTFTATRIGWTKGFVDYSALLAASTAKVEAATAAAKNATGGQAQTQHQPKPQAHNYQGHNYNPNYQRGRGRGFRGRFRPRR